MQVTGHESSRSAAKLRARVAHGDGLTALRLDGVIDEHNGLAAIAEQLPPAAALAVDLAGVKRLNSVGVRDWVNWLRALRPRYATILLIDCPPPVMNEVNFVKNFAEGTSIVSFGVPLFCSRCNKEETRVFETERIRNGGGLVLPPLACERKDCLNALDDDEDGYLGFARSQPDAVPPDRLAQLTSAARALLAAATPVDPTPRPLDPHARATASRSQPLGQLGLQGQPRRTPEPGGVPNPLAPPSSSAHAPGASRLDVSPSAAASRLDGSPSAAASRLDVSPSAAASRLDGSPSAAASTASKLDAALAPGATPLPRAQGGDWLFIAAMAAMLAVLGVLVYLILTLE